MISPNAQRPCPLCGTRSPSSWLRKQDLLLVRCPDCTLVYADPLPTESAPEHYDQLGRPYYLSADKLAGDFASVRFERELRLFRRHCVSGQVLDVGCSTGAFLFQLRQRFPGAYQPAGIEVSLAALDHARNHGLEVIGDSLLTHDFGPRRFDAICFWAVLEHLPEPSAFIHRAAEILRPGGRVFALVPNLESLAVRLLGARYRYILNQHVNYFTTDTLASLLKRQGLEVIDAGGSHFNPMVLWQDWRRGTDAPVPDAERAALLKRTTHLKQAPWLRPVKWALRVAEQGLATAGLADNLWAVARKPST